jgi:hypothetical protein
MNRHEGADWADVEKLLREKPEKIRSLHRMEETGGEPDVFSSDAGKSGYMFFDFSAESPSGRRSLCYDREALESRKEFKPETSVLDMAAEMGVSLLSEEEYRAMQQTGAFDKKTSSWVFTPHEIRSLGGAIFCDRRYNHVFTYHNGAESYYSARGFRAALRV